MKRAVTIAVAAVLAVGTLTACNGSGAPSNPTVGQTWRQPGNEDLCVWDGSSWRETDDNEPCEDSGSHKASKPKSSVKYTSPKSTTRRSIFGSSRRSNSGSKQ